MAKILALLVFVQLTYAQFAVKSYYEIRNQNVIRQQYEESCGAASISTILNMIDLNNTKKMIF
ncbi:hypothetical protein [Campylobacter fetus]|uniref:hypothetical protein n=1 Tax=Campylobacter fetus TaxID=196 RepID=UPI002FCDFEAB